MCRSANGGCVMCTIQYILGHQRRQQPGENMYIHVHCALCIVHCALCGGRSAGGDGDNGGRSGGDQMLIAPHSKYNTNTMEIRTRVI